MAQIFDPLPSSSNTSIVCCYVNATSRIQIARITNVPNWYFERVVFPGQRLVFEATSDALLEIHCGMMASAILADTIPCDRLQVEDAIVPEFVNNLFTSANPYEWNYTTTPQVGLNNRSIPYSRVSGLATSIKT